MLKITQLVSVWAWKNDSWSTWHWGPPFFQDTLVLLKMLLWGWEQNESTIRPTRFPKPILLGHLYQKAGSLPRNTNLARVWDTDMYQWGKLPAKEQCSNVKQKVVQAWGQLVTKSHQAVHAKLLSSPGCVSSSEWAEPRHSISNTFGFLDWVFSLSYNLYASILSRELKEFAPHSHFTSYPWVNSIISV